MTQKVRDRYAEHGELRWGAGEYACWLGDPTPGVFKCFVVVMGDGASYTFDDTDAVHVIPGVTPRLAVTTPTNVVHHAGAIVAANYSGKDMTFIVQKL